MEDRLPPVPDQKTMVLVNTFLVHTTQLLNRFAALSETKLAEINRRVHRIDAALSLLETKLRSAELQLGSRTAGEGATGPAGGTPSVDDQSVSESGGCGPEDQKDPSQPGLETFLPDHASSSAPSVADSAEKQARPRVSEHPDYARFFRMLAVGVPSQAIAMQMRIEGLDPAFLKRPDNPFPEAPI